jgi:putative membrane protein
MALRTSRLRMILFIGMLATVGVVACQRHGESRVQAAGEENKPAVGQIAAISPADKTFIVDAEKLSIQERYLGRLAREKSQDDAVKNYAQMVVNDHNRALQNLVGLMQQKGISQPTGLPESREEALDELKGLSGSAFERKFIVVMIHENEKNVDLFTQELNTVRDNDVRKYAADLLPVLKNDLQKALQLQEKSVP